MSPSEIDQLSEQADVLVRSAAGRPESARAAGLAQRLRSGRFTVCVVGEFKRGKSTLVNALVGEEVVPTGVLPLTAVRTELAYGPPSTIVEHIDGTRQPIERSAVRDYVAEQLNPANVKQVARVVMTGEWGLLAGGVVLMDTPGVGSIYDHNSEEARSALLEADGAIVVLAADAPLSASERDMLSILRDRHAPTFFVLNKVDHLTPAELSQVRQFAATAIENCLGHSERIFALDARSALSASPGGGHRPEAGFEFGELFAELRRFVDQDLVGALVRGARRDLADLGRSLLDSLTVEKAALELNSAELARLARDFEQTADEEQRAFVDDRTLLRRDVTELVRLIRSRLEDFARAEPGKYFQELEATAARAPKSRLTEELWATIEGSVRSSFDSFRIAECERAEASWHVIAGTFRHKTEERVAAVREAASELFKIDLPRLDIPAVRSERERFFYLFLHIGSSTDLLSSFAARFVPARVARRRALRKAKQELAGEFAKHAGRAARDLVQRLEEACRALERSMQSELETCGRAILEAADRAERRRVDLERARRDTEGEAAVQWELAVSLTRLSQAS